MKIPLAEHFHSIQGEGSWAGTPMHFIRLPGCSVGINTLSRVGEKLAANIGHTPILPSGKPAWLCHRWDGVPFWCDTDFGKYEEVEVEELLAETWEDRICITGGEPLLHPRSIEALGYKKFLHLETSGTIAGRPENVQWMTVSPKTGCLSSMLRSADELKLLVAEHNVIPLDSPFLTHPNVYVSPVNRIDRKPTEVNHPNLELCLDLLRQHPNWKLSVQLHKYLGMR